MMPRSKGLSLLLAVALSGLVVSSPAAAQATYAFSAAASGSSCTSAGGVNPGDSPGCVAQGGIIPTIEVWTYMGAVPGTAAVPGGWTAARVGVADGAGLGAYSRNNESDTDSRHALDNVTTGCGSGSGAGGGNNPLVTGNGKCGGSVEALLVNFGSSRVNLTSISTGYIAGDADLSSYRWDGSAMPTLPSSIMTGWTMVGSGDLGDTRTPGSDGGTDPFLANQNRFSSSFLISTYFGALKTTLDSGNDRFKIDAFAVVACNGTPVTGAGCSSTAPGIPEPASLALVAGALLAGAALRRRRESCSRPDSRRPEPTT